MPRKQKEMQRIIEEQKKDVSEEEVSEESEYSSEDDDAALLTDKVEEKLLTTLAKIRSKDPQIYSNKVSFFQDEDFERGDQVQKKHTQSKQEKYTYKDMMMEEDNQSQEEQEQAPAIQEKKAKKLLKQAITTNLKKLANNEDDMFTVKEKIKSEKIEEKEEEKDKFKEFTKPFDKTSKKLIKKIWDSNQLDETDLFLKQYILNKKWLSDKNNISFNKKQKMIDEEDEERGKQMDQYEAEYNFRFEEPGGTKITQYPRVIQNSLRQKPQTRKEKRKNLLQKKKEEEEMIRKEALSKKEELKKNILNKLVPEDEIDHDWFFCDDCCKALAQYEVIWQCEQCEDYMLCRDCYELIIHPHTLTKSKIPKGCGPPLNCEDALVSLKPCKFCRRQITPTQKRYQYQDRSYIINTICEFCYDSANLEIKKKYKEVEAQTPNYEQILEQDPEKIKEITSHEQIEKLVDEYIKNDFQGVISGGLKTKFRYLKVKAEDYGLSDEQILYGSDKQLNKYVSIKKLYPYADEEMKVRNYKYKKMIGNIKKSTKINKQMVRKGFATLQKMRYLSKMNQRKEAKAKRQTKKIKLLNLSNPQQQKQHFIPSTRLQSYGIQGQSQNN